MIFMLKKKSYIGSFNETKAMLDSHPKKAMEDTHQLKTMIQLIFGIAYTLEYFR